MPCSEEYCGNPYLIRLPIDAVVEHPPGTSVLLNLNGTMPCFTNDALEPYILLILIAGIVPE